jgi:signal peptidase I
MFGVCYFSEGTDGGVWTRAAPLFYQNPCFFIDILQSNDYTVYMAKAVLSAFAAAIIIKLFLFDFIIADGISMEPAIRNGTVMFVNRLQYGLRFPGRPGYLVRWAAPRQGDVVVFYAPSGSIAVKRCSDLTEKGEFIAQGDNSLQSYDSRSYGPVPADSTIGKVLGIK